MFSVRFLYILLCCSSLQFRLIISKILGVLSDVPFAHVPFALFAKQNGYLQKGESVSRTAMINVTPVSNISLTINFIYSL